MLYSPAPSQMRLWRRATLALLVLLSACLSIVLMPALAGALSSSSHSLRTLSVEAWALLQGQLWTAFLLGSLSQALLCRERAHQVSAVLRHTLILCVLGCAPNFAYVWQAPEGVQMALNAVSLLVGLVLWLDLVRMQAAALKFAFTSP